METLEEFNGRKAKEAIALKKQNQNFENVVGELQGTGKSKVTRENKRLSDSVNI